LSLSNGHAFHQIGTDQGLLPAPIELKRLSLAPGERADLIVDFSTSAGEQIIVTNDSSFHIMQFLVAKNAAKNTVRDTSTLPSALRPVPKIPESAAVKTRMLTLVEVDDLVQRPVTMLLNNTHWNMPVPENPVLDSTEIWNLINTTDDSHPIFTWFVSKFSTAAASTSPPIGPPAS
jgi:spore coat protein A